MGTFNGLTFEERGNSGVMTPIHGATGLTSVRTLARTGTNPVFDLGGETVAQLSFPVRVTSGELGSLRFNTGTDGQLVYAGGTVNAAFVELKGAVLVKDAVDLYFATLDFLVFTSDTVIQYPDAQFTVNGSSAPNVLEVTVSHGVEQDAGQATIVYTDDTHGATEGGSVSLALGYGSPAVVFAGTVTGRAWDHFPLGVAIDCRDRMEYLTYPYGGTERTYIAAEMGTVWQNLVEAQGVDSSNTSIEHPGWTVGIIEPVVFRRGDRFLPWIRESASLAGYCIFTKGADSAIYVRPYDESVTGAGTHILTEGVNIISAHRELSRDGIINAVQVDGLTFLGATVQVFMATANADVRNPPGTISANVQSNLIESPTRASAVASTYLDHHNFKPESYTFVLPGTAIEPMDMLHVTYSDLGLSGATVTVTQREYRFSTAGYVTTLHAKRITR